MFRIFNYHKIAFTLVCIIPLLVLGQNYNHWTRSFNEESSLLSGAVVGGGAGPSAIYYNPASISEITQSKFSVNVSLFTLQLQGADNVLGEDIDLNSTKFKIEPRFISYMIQPKKRPEMSFELAFLNNQNYLEENSQSVDKQMDILTNIPGTERYYAFFQYSNSYRDDWIGAGWSWKFTPRFYVGASMFVSIRSLEYRYLLNIEAYPLDSVFIEGQYIPFYSANYYQMEYLKCNDYRLLWKVGLLYTVDHYSFGINFTTPSVGGIYSDGKKVTREMKQANIVNPETDLPLPDYILADFQEKDKVTVNAKSPFSLAAGFTYQFKKRKRILYLTAEYFGGLDPYQYAKAEENQDLMAGSFFENIEHTEWLTYISGAKPVLNAAIGYEWLVKENFMILSGFRTDFNYQKNYNYDPYSVNKVFKSIRMDLYHLTGGLSRRVKGQDIMIGLQYTIGREKNQQQIVNLSDPVEFNTVENAPLQGTKQNTMKSHYNAISIYFGATINFGGGDKK